MRGAHRGAGVEVEGRVNRYRTPQANFKTLLNKNAKKNEIGNFS